jgi:ABC-type dipeptide/oligopeptide/nickel transport system permease subunit
VKSAWRIVIIAFGILLAAAAVCTIVGIITGAKPERIYSVFQRLFEMQYNINLDELINTWVPQVIDTISQSI